MGKAKSVGSAVSLGDLEDWLDSLRNCVDEARLLHRSTKDTFLRDRADAIIIELMEVSGAIEATADMSIRHK